MKKYSEYLSTLNLRYTGLLGNGTSIIEKNWLENKYYDFYLISFVIFYC